MKNIINNKNATNTNNNKNDLVENEIFTSIKNLCNNKRELKIH